MSIRAAFVDRFGEDNATAIEAAANEHKNGVHDSPGSDPFKWALLIAIGYECVTRYADYHHVTADQDELREWCLEHADLASHDGDCDFLAMIVGAYAGWVVELDESEVSA